MRSSTTAPRKIEPNHTPAVIEPGVVLTAEELRRRLRWQKHSYAQARRLGLRTVRFGSRNYVLSSDVVSFFERLAQEQNAEEN